MTFDEAAERVREQHRVVRNAIDACLGNDHVLPALMLLYAAIDAMGWLARPAGAEQSGEHFRDYVDRYVRKPTDEATAMDLWGARCGILHEQTPESNASRMGRAQMITYDLENGQSLVQIRIPGTNR
jgi:hypothetical protein